MSSKRRLRRRSCEGKARHADKTGAVLAVNQLWVKSRARVHPYECRFCGGWHVGRPPEKRGRKSEKLWKSLRRFSR